MSSNQSLKLLVMSIHFLPTIELEELELEKEICF